MEKIKTVKLTESHVTLHGDRYLATPIWTQVEFADDVFQET